MYVDDWAHVLESTTELHNAWACWRVWEPISGSQVGVKGFKKTVLTGVRWVDGKARLPEDPLLVTGRGEPVPLLPPDEAYKHLGILRRIDGVSDPAKKEFTKKWMAALSRLRGLRKPTVAEFTVASAGLLETTGGAYLHAMYLSFEEADFLEGKWRKVYNRFFCRDPSAPRAELYPFLSQSARRRQGTIVRTHLAAVGMSSLVSATMKALADVHPTGQRAACESSIAFALSKWGCRCSPNEFGLSHLSGTIAETLKGQKARDLGDAVLLALGLLEGAHPEGGEEVEEELAAEAARVAAAGRWRGWCNVGPASALWQGANYFSPHVSQPLFEPCGSGGLGLAPEAALLEIRVAEIGHLCMPTFVGDTWGGVFMSSEEASSRIAGWPGGTRVRKAWDRVVDALVVGDVHPVRAVRVCPLERSRPLAREEAVDAEAVDALVQQLGRMATGEEGPGDQRSMRRSLSRCFVGASPRPAKEWHTGIAGGGEEGARVVMAEGEKGTTAWGGEARFLRRQDQGFSPVGSRDDFRIGADGFALGWEEAVEAQMEEIGVDEGGFLTVVDGGDDRRAGLADLESLGPCLQLVARARLLLEEWSSPAVTTGQGKRKGCTVDVVTALSNVLDMAEWQAKLRITVAFATDGSWIKGKGAARAFFRHDGEYESGMLDEPEGEDNYIAELVALLDALSSLPSGERVLIVVDALSPLWALRRFSHSHDRVKQQFYCDDLLSQLASQVSRAEAVVFVWQTSHAGSPANEIADLLAGVEENLGSTSRVVRERSPHYHISLAAPSRSVREWATERARWVVASWLRQSVVNTQFESPGDIAVGRLDDRDEAARRRVLGERRTAADFAACRDPALERIAQRVTCPAGCRLRSDPDAPVRPTWSHQLFFCCAPRLQEARRRWLDGGHGLLGLAQVCNVLETPAKGNRQVAGHHGQFQDVAHWVRRGLNGIASGFGDDVLIEKADFAAADGGAALNCRRGAGALWQTTGDVKRDAAASTVATLRQAGVLGLRVLEEGDELCRELRVAMGEASGRQSGAIAR